ncbi:hypothetical protein [Spirosoma utsteinense]|uniref:PA14 domain-containing protein n=1 Tax=Spirosoma utsteinense TaxID=2585773 RepID=A0ABR6WAL3_9BACT|nr:hypothetical protein [Spirosoma utsteinense]MBC3783868.1 hypothetical protein [Spirosoma utsteinense]MBC3793553.1 hypothetical protein [Spirosoma utsteinense]
MNKQITSFFQRIAPLLLAWLLVVPLYAQQELPALPPAQLNRPAGWQLVGAVSTTADGASLKTQPGSTILTGAGEPLTLLTPTDDFRLRFDMLLSANTDFVLTMPTGQAMSFTGTQEMARLTKAPGLWQTVDVWYKTGKGHALLEKLALNGVTVRESQTLNNAKSGPLTIMAKTGSVAIRNIGYRVMSPRLVAQWSSPVSYTIVEGGYVTSRIVAQSKKVLKQDTASLLTYEVSYGQPRQHSILFSGKLTALQAGDYQFELNQGGVGGVWIDGKEIIPTDHRELGQSSFGTANLTAGPHTVEVYFSRSWFRPGLGLFVSQAGTRSQPLHSLSSLPEPDPVAVVSVQPTTKAELIRSFVQMPGEKTKRTHSLSVGSPEGLHYTVDLNQMALLQTWKGDFANVTEMWYERGEPQLLSPMGVTVRPPAQSPLVVLTNETTAWPDSLGENVLQYKGLTVDKQGMPTVEYTLAGTTVTDAIRPDGNALVRTLTLKGSPDGTPYCRVAAGTTIDEVGKGLYAVNDRSYFVRFDPKAKVKLRQSNGKQELLLPIDMKSGAGTVQYSIVF